MRILSAAFRYGIALGCVAAALALSVLLQELFPYPFFFLFFAAVMASAWFGGTAPGLFAAAASTIAVDYYFIPPYRSLTVNAANTVNFAAFVLCALVANWVSSKRKESEKALTDARDQLEARVAQRT